MAKNELTKVDETENEVALLEEMALDAGQGFEEQSAEDYSIPFLDILQGNSPELNTLEGARPGMILNKVTGDLYDGKKGIAFVPAYTRHVFVEWKPRESGGGYVGEHALDSDLVKHVRTTQPMGKYRTPDGNELIETFYVYGVLVRDDGAEEQCVIAFTSTKIGPYKGWMTKARSIQIVLPDGRRINPALFAHRYRLRTVFIEKNNYKWHNWQITFDGDKAEDCRISPKSSTYAVAKATAEVVRSNKVKVNYDQSREAANPGEGSGVSELVGEDPPF